MPTFLPFWAFLTWRGLKRMSQIPVNVRTYSRLSVLKAKCVIEKNGGSTTWDDIISASLDVVGANTKHFISQMKKKRGKTRTMNTIKDAQSAKEAVDSGERVTSEQLEKLNKPKTFTG